jgi:hypothetical protein
MSRKKLYFHDIIRSCHLQLGMDRLIPFEKKVIVQIILQVSATELLGFGL